MSKARRKECLGETEEQVAGGNDELYTPEYRSVMGTRKKITYVMDQTEV